jgi:hypothetical protein
VGLAVDVAGEVLGRPTELEQRLLEVAALVVPSVPAMKLPMAAVANAAPARPRRAIWWPSSAVTMVALSPGVFSRIEVVEPPYMPP